MNRTVFRITPHQSVLNSASRNFQRSLYELLSVRQKSRIEGFRIIRKAAPDFWWITKLASDSIEYYCALPTEFAESFRTKFRNHEQWRKSTLEIVDDFDLSIAEHTEVYALKYRRHDMFSLDFRYNEQSTPVRDLLGVTNELNDGEAIVLFIRTETVDRGRWKKLADYAWSTWDGGKVPYRPGFDPILMARFLFGSATYLFYGVKSVIDDVLAGIERTFYHNPSPLAKKERLSLPNPDRAELLVNGDLSPMTKNKRNIPVFKTSIRYAVTAADPVKRDMLARSVANAYGEMAGDNRLESVRVNIRGKTALNDFTDMMPNLMSVDEIGKLEQLPTADIQAEFTEVLTSNRRVEIELPAVFLDDSGVLAGTTTDRGAEHNVYISAKNPDRLFYGRAYVGMQGMGKDQAIINLIVEAKRKHGIGAIIPDVINERNGHRGMADAIRDHLPAEDVIDIDLANTDFPVYLGLRSVVKNVKDSRIAADRIAEEIAQFLLADGDDDKFQTMDYLREAAKATFGDLQDIKYMFTSQPFRKRKIKELDGKFDMDTWRDFDRMTDKDGGMSGRQGQIYGPIQRRLGQIINSEFLKPIFCQRPNPAMDLYRWIDEGKIVIFRFPKEDVISRRVIELLVYWIVLNVFLIKVAQDGKSNALGTYLVLNEPHQYLSDGLVRFMERMLTEGRKKRLAPIFAFHNFKQFREHPGFVDILKTGINWHVFKNANIKMYEELMPQLGKTFESAQQAMDATRQFQYIAAWINDLGEEEPPFVVDALPLVSKRYPTADNANLTLKHAQKYGRPVMDVLAEIKRRERAAMRVEETPKEPAIVAPPSSPKPEDEAPSKKKRTPTSRRKKAEKEASSAPENVETYVVYRLEPPSARICGLDDAMDFVANGWTLFGNGGREAIDECGREIARKLGLDPDDIEWTEG